MSDIVARLRRAAFVRFKDGFESTTLAREAAEALSLKETGLKIAMTKIAAFEARIAELEADPSPQPKNMLSWVEGTHVSTDDDNGPMEGIPPNLKAWRAGPYTIIRQRSETGLFLLSGRSSGVGLAVSSLEEAKAAAQADYDSTHAPHNNVVDRFAPISDQQIRDIMDCGDPSTARIKICRLIYQRTKPAPQPNALPQDVIGLVIAAREFWGPNYDLSWESRALEKALEAFSSRVPYEDEPDLNAAEGSAK